MEPEEDNSKADAFVPLQFSAHSSSATTSSFDRDLGAGQRWADLIPSDVVRTHLVQFAWEKLDICALRGVCKKWHSSVRLPYIIVDAADLRSEREYMLKHMCFIAPEIRIEVHIDAGEQDEPQPSLGSLFEAALEGNIQSVRLKQTNLSEHNYNLLVDFVRKSHSLRSFAAEDSQIFSPANVPSLFFNQVVNKISSLHLERCGITSDHLHQFGQSLLSSPTVKLVSLNLSQNGIESFPEVFLKAMQQKALNINTLILDENDVTSFGWLANLVERSDSLRHLSLCAVCKRTDQEELEVFFKALSINRSLLELRVQELISNEDSIRALSSALATGAPLRILDLTGSVLSPEEGTILSQGIRDSRFLRELHLGRNNLGRPGGMTLADALAENNTLEILDLSFNKIGPDATARIAQWLRKNQTLKVLLLDTCDIGDLGINELSIMLHENRTLKSLSLPRNKLDADDVAALGPALAANTSLRELKLFLNFLGDRGVAALADGISNNQSLLHLDLSFNQLRDVAAVYLAQIFRTNLSLKEIEIHGNSFGFESKELLEEAWAWHLRQVNFH